MHHIGPTIGVIEPGDDTFCMVTIGGDHDWIARYLIGLELRFEVIEPPEVNDELRALAERMLRQLAEHPLAIPDADADALGPLDECPLQCIMMHSWKPARPSEQSCVANAPCGDGLSTGPRRDLA